MAAPSGRLRRRRQRLLAAQAVGPVPAVLDHRADLEDARTFGEAHVAAEGLGATDADEVRGLGGERLRPLALFA